ncbi:hypothetical protein M569_12347, partial [Genlisea aurea]
MDAKSVLFYNTEAVEKENIPPFKFTANLLPAAKLGTKRRRRRRRPPLRDITDLHRAVSRYGCGKRRRADRFDEFESKGGILRREF